MIYTRIARCVRIYVNNSAYLRLYVKLYTPVVEAGDYLVHSPYKTLDIGPRVTPADAVRRQIDTASAHE